MKPHEPNTLASQVNSTTPPYAAAPTEPETLSRRRSGILPRVKHRHRAEGDYGKDGRQEMALLLSGIASMALLRNTTSGENILGRLITKQVNKLKMLINTER